MTGAGMRVPAGTSISLQSPRCCLPGLTPQFCCDTESKSETLYIVASYSNRRKSWSGTCSLLVAMQEKMYWSTRGMRPWCVNASTEEFSSHPVPARIQYTIHRDFRSLVAKCRHTCMVNRTSFSSDRVTNVVAWCISMHGNWLPQLHFYFSLSFESKKKKTMRNSVSLTFHRVCFPCPCLACEHRYDTETLRCTVMLASLPQHETALYPAIHSSKREEER